MSNKFYLIFLFCFVFVFCFFFGVFGVGRFWCKYYLFMIGILVFIYFVDVMSLYFCI